MVDRVRFAIRFDSWYRVLSSVLFLPPSSCFVEIQGEEVHVQMGWAFRTSFPRLAVASISRLTSRPMSRGVHGLSGRWLVNGSGESIALVPQPGTNTERHHGRIHIPGTRHSFASKAGKTILTLICD
jgi:hypothetical protein